MTPAQHFEFRKRAAENKEVKMPPSLASTMSPSLAST